MIFPFLCLCGYRPCLRQAAHLPRRFPFTGHAIHHVVAGYLHTSPIWEQLIWMASCSTIPIDVGKEMGSEVTLGNPFERLPRWTPKQTMGSSFGVLGQAISVMSAANELRSMEQADILVTVPLLKYTTLDYNKADAIIKAGYDAAASKPPYWLPFP